jgi:alkylated DNA repair protein (DNA oxidative demethylase)
LFEAVPDARPSREAMAEGAVLLRGFTRPFEAELLPALRAIVKQAPFRHLITPGGHRMSVAMTNCGSVGWVSDSTGYRYDAIDPESGQRWPAMPTVLRRLAADAASDAGFNGFEPEACLINRYVPGAKLSLHQDKDELDFAAPIVSVSLGLPAIFLFGGPKRADKPNRYRLEHGDVVVWGGPSRLFFTALLHLPMVYIP